MQDISARRESLSTFKAKTDMNTPSSGDNAVSQLLGKLDEAGQTIANLRSILTFKTAELNELVGQLELTNQAIENVETTTANIETMLTEMGLSMDTIETHTRESMLLNAQASLDHALKSANNIYANETDHNGVKLSRRRSLASSSSGGIHSESSEKKERMNTHYGPSKIRYKPDSKPILRELHELIRQLGLDSAKFFQSIGSTDDVQKLQKAYVDLEIAKTISLAAKTNMKRRTIMLRRVRRRDVIEEVDILGIKIREAVAMWQEYTHCAPLLVDGKDILDILDREDDLISKNLPVYKRMSIDISTRNSPTPSTSGTTRRLKSTLSTGSNGSNPSTPTKLTASNHSPDIADNNNNTTQHVSPHRYATISGGAKNKTLHRHSTGSTVRPVIVKPSATSASTMLPRAPLMIKPPVNHNNKKDVTAAAAPEVRPPPAVTVNSGTVPNGGSVENEPRKESKLQKPSYMGPGSTLRLRSMMAKRSASNI